MADFETVVCVKNEVFVYKIPARSSNRGYRAAEWKLDQPDWTGRLRVCALGKNITIKLDDRNTGELFAQCPVEEYPSIAVEQVLDSSRYFVIRIQDGSGRSAFIGIGFADRGDSFDLLVALQDHFKRAKRDTLEDNKSAQSLEESPKLDLGFKEGQTIRINIATKHGENASAKPRPKTGGGSGGLLPPPPGGVKISAPPKPAAPSPEHHAAPPAQSSHSNVDLLLDLGAPPPVAPVSSTSQPSDPWGDFTSAGRTPIDSIPCQKHHAWMQA
ncbi:hypothetical protein CAPTEDRAFT_219974 [Capitella teleta]|uniref:NECAP PHear domain-containing protein n=1 Tax=Capitella teleta TaxID=283909 RepID=R7TD93_CAPTE|nr:hypothetical protein CAPTEDRAFT_219974 [Capitella teleta]|eukprot:ELT89457.1 hypothetical protein CAPTEDRAFT_219974 [Capitella teleta]